MRVNKNRAVVLEPWWQHHCVYGPYNYRDASGCEHPGVLFVSSTEESDRKWYQNNSQYWQLYECSFTPEIYPSRVLGNCDYRIDLGSIYERDNDSRFYTDLEQYLNDRVFCTQETKPHTVWVGYSDSPEVTHRLDLYTQAPEMLRTHWYDHSVLSDVWDPSRWYQAKNVIFKGMFKWNTKLSIQNHL